MGKKITLASIVTVVTLAAAIGVMLFPDGIESWKSNITETDVRMDILEKRVNALDIILCKTHNEVCQDFLP